VQRSALILAGGSGTRFWPASRGSRPKQLLALDGEKTLLQATVERLAPVVGPDEVWISTTQRLAEAVREELPQIAPGRILTEPSGRNTAPAIAASLAAMPEAARAGVVAVLPSDHRVADAGAFRASLEAAAGAAAGLDRIVALGVRPRWAETGFGYLELGAPLEGGPDGLTAVGRFREKPDRATAETFVASGRHLWNAGIFVFRGATLLAELARHAPELAAGVAAWDRGGRTPELYEALPSISIDYAVMERTDRMAALALDCGWDDLGSWQALYEVLAADGRGNRVHGDVVEIDSANNLLFAERGLIAALGVSDLVVVRTGDAVLVLPRERAQEVRRLVERLRDDGRDELL
jgi:mannose-1-phosphate guanylyltransferase/mannose-6-phosphate isomerase